MTSLNSFFQNNPTGTLTIVSEDNKASCEIYKQGESIFFKIKQSSHWLTKTELADKTVELKNRIAKNANLKFDIKIFENSDNSYSFSLNPRWLNTIDTALNPVSADIQQIPASAAVRFIQHDSMMRHIHNHLKVGGPQSREVLPGVIEQQKKQQVFITPEFVKQPREWCAHKLKQGYAPILQQITDIDQSHLTPKLTNGQDDNRYRAYSKYLAIAGPVNFYYMDDSTEEIGVLTANGINLMGSSQEDSEKYYTRDSLSRRQPHHSLPGEFYYPRHCFELNEDIFAHDINKLAKFWIQSVQKAGYNHLVMPAVGVGVYINTLTNDSKQKAIQLTVKAFANAVYDAKVDAQSKGDDFKLTWVVWDQESNRSLQQPALEAILAKEVDKVPQLSQVIQFKTGEVIDEGFRKKADGDKTIIFNAGSDRTVGGRYFDPNARTVEEQLASRSNLILVQGHCNQHLVKMVQLQYDAIAYPADSNYAHQPHSGQPQPFWPGAVGDDSYPIPVEPMPVFAGGGGSIPYLQNNEASGPSDATHLLNDLEISSPRRRLGLNERSLEKLKEGVNTVMKAVIDAMEKGYNGASYHPKHQSLLKLQKQLMRMGNIEDIKSVVERFALSCSKYRVYRWDILGLFHAPFGKTRGANVFYQNLSKSDLLTDLGYDSMQAFKAKIQEKADGQPQFTQPSHSSF